MAAPQSASRRVRTYLVLTLALSSIFWFLIIRAGTLSGGNGMWVLGLMWCPGVAAILASLATGRPLSQIGWRWSWRYAALGYAIPVAYGAVAYGATRALGLGAFPDAAFVATQAPRFGGPGASTAEILARYVLLQGSAGVLFSCVSGLGEEIGWRGFLVPELFRRMSFTRVALVSGAIWAAWHYPILLFADYNAGTAPVYGLACFTVLVVGIAFVFAWIRLKSGSVWPAAILHGSHNLWIQQVFDPLTADTGRTKWIIGEFGAALAVTAIGVAWLTWRCRAQILLPAAEAA
jgi:membrane protease YdiL (CAAX protease family)